MGWLPPHAPASSSTNLECRSAVVEEELEATGSDSTPPLLLALELAVNEVPATRSDDVEPVGDAGSVDGVGGPEMLMGDATTLLPVLLLPPYASPG